MGSLMGKAKTWPIHTHPQSSPNLSTKLCTVHYR
jgi:hypothetical protein